MPTAKEVRELSEGRNISFIEAKKIIEKRELMNQCQEATTFSELQDILLRVINIAV